MPKKILFIEDNLIKLEAVLNVLNSNIPNAVIITKDSFRSGLKELMDNSFDILLLDMSLPTWDREGVKKQEGFERFGGETIMREMKRKSKLTPTVVITMFSEFGIGKSFIDLVDLDRHLKSEFKEFYKGFVKYSSSERKWEDELKTVLGDL
jgi:CheY-like chemotaxis protein